MDKAAAKQSLGAKAPGGTVLPKKASGRVPKRQRLVRILFVIVVMSMNSAVSTVMLSWPAWISVGSKDPSNFKKTRRIRDLSRPFGNSTNDLILVEKQSSLTVADAYARVRSPWYMCKVDLSAAYRYIPVAVSTRVVAGVRCKDYIGSAWWCNDVPETDAC